MIIQQERVLSATLTIHTSVWMPYLNLSGRDKRHCLLYNLLMLLHSGWRNNVFDHVFWQRNKGKFEGATLMSQGPCGDAKLKDLARFFS